MYKSMSRPGWLCRLDTVLTVWTVATVQTAEDSSKAPLVDRQLAQVLRKACAAWLWRHLVGPVCEGVVAELVALCLCTGLGVARKRKLIGLKHTMTPDIHQTVVMKLQ
jgi:hypothetical protein